MCGSPAWIAAWRAGFLADAGRQDLPMITSDTCSGATPARSSTLRITSAPRSDAGVRARLPPNLPIGVRAAPTMTDSLPWLPLVSGLIIVVSGESVLVDFAGLKT